MTARREVTAEKRLMIFRLWDMLLLHFLMRKLMFIYPMEIIHHVLNVHTPFHCISYLLYCAYLMFVVSYMIMTHTRHTKTVNIVLFLHVVKICSVQPSIVNLYRVKGEMAAQ